MSAKVAINGLGRIGRAILRAVMEDPSCELVAVNDLMDVENLAYLLRFDSTYGRYSKPVEIKGGDLVVAGRRLRTLRNRDPRELPWKELGVELVFECTGALTRREDLEKHLGAGARFVLLSAPSKGGEVETIVHGVNLPGGTTSIISCASCTTNCITPIVEIIGRRIGIKSAALATTLALPEYTGRFDGIAIRAPIPVGSIADITFVTSRPTTVDEVNQIMSEEAETERYAGVVGVSRDPLVSSDVLGDPRGSIVDLELTKVVDGDLVKVMSWYDNEWGYANQMLRAARSITKGAGSSAT
jgi:glyceraldehyde 3-phosphate dehydrogenase